MSRRFRVELIAEANLSARVRMLSFRARDGFAWAAGQYVELFMTEDGSSRVPLSIASAMDRERPGEFELAVARGGSAEGLDELRVGDELRAVGPLGSFIWQPCAQRAALLVSGGTGVAPLRALVQEQLGRGGATELVLLCGYRGESDVLWAAELGSLAERHRRFKFEPTLSQASSAWSGRRGRVQEHVSDLLAPLGPEVFAYVCGQTAMVDDVTERLRAHGIDASRIRGEGY